jgi:hypothetical protein
MNIGYLIYLCFIDVAIRKMLQQVLESKYTQLFFKQVGPLRSYAFQVFYGTG